MECKHFNELKTNATYVVEGYEIHYSLHIRKEGSNETFAMWAAEDFTNYIKSNDIKPTDKFTFVASADKYPVILSKING